MIEAPTSSDPALALRRSVGDAMHGGGDPIVRAIGGVATAHRELATVRSLRESWRALSAETACSAAQTYDYAVAAWEAKAHARSTILNIISVHMDGELAAIWPLYIERVGLTKVIQHLGCGNHEEYDAPLSRQGPAGAAADQAAFALVRSQADILKVHNIPPNDGLAQQLDALPEARKSSVFSPIVVAPQSMTWAEWFSSRSKSFRFGLRYDRRRLEQIGPVQLKTYEAAADIQRVVDWIFSVKSKKLKEQNIFKNWVYIQDNLDFLAKVASTSEQVNVYALMVGDEIAAAAIALESKSLFEFFMTSFNPEFSKYSPGNLLLEDLVKRCFESRQTFDFRITSEPYKSRWADGARQYDRYVVPLTQWGSVVLRTEHMLPGPPALLKSAVKKMLKRLRPA